MPPKPAPPGAYPFHNANFHSLIRMGSAPPIQMRVWVSPAGVREETRREEKTTHSLSLQGEVYVWVEGTHSGMRLSSSGAPRLSGLPDTLDVLRDLATDLRPEVSHFAGRDTVSGYKTLRYDFRVRDPLVKVERSGSIWLLEDRAFPVKYVNSGFGGDYTIVNSDLRFDVEMPGGFFAPPADVRFSPLKTFR